MGNRIQRSGNKLVKGVINSYKRNGWKKKITKQGYKKSKIQYLLEGLETRTDTRIHEQINQTLSQHHFQSLNENVQNEGNLQKGQKDLKCRICKKKETETQKHQLKDELT